MTLVTLPHTTLAQDHWQLMMDIQSCDNMIDPSVLEDQCEPDSVAEQEELVQDLELMCQELGIIEEVINLKQPADCDCFH